MRVADAIIDLVRGNPPAGGLKGDTGEAVMFGTYVRALRRFVRIRDLARDSAGEETAILARSLLSMIARAIWIDYPTDRDERVERFNRWKKRELKDEVTEARGLRDAGFPVDEFDFDDHEADLAKLSGVEPMPNDRDLLSVLKLVQFDRRAARRS